VEPGDRADDGEAEAVSAGLAIATTTNLAGGLLLRLRDA
jgi:hypothetical protein